MKRFIFHLAFALALGVVVNIAVAWACGSWSVPDASAMRHGSLAPSQVQDGSRLPISAMLVNGFGVAHLQVIPLMLFNSPNREPLEDLVNDFGVVRDLSVLPYIDDGQPIDLFAQGWPLRTLWCERQANSQAMHGGVWLSSSIVPGTFYSAEHVLAFRPIWRGFAVNTILYASVIWLLFTIPLALRRRHRIRHNLCPRCAYPIGTSTICSECGAPVARMNTPVTAP